MILVSSQLRRIATIPKSSRAAQATVTIGTVSWLVSGGAATGRILGIVGFLRKFFHSSVGSSGVSLDGNPPASSVASAGTNWIFSLNNAQSIETCLGSLSTG